MRVSKRGSANQTATNFNSIGGNRYVQFEHVRVLPVQEQHQPRIGLDILFPKSLLFRFLQVWNEPCPVSLRACVPQELETFGCHPFVCHLISLHVSLKPVACLCFISVCSTSSYWYVPSTLELYVFERTNIKRFVMTTSFLLVHSVWCLNGLIGWAHSLQRLGNVACPVGFLLAMPLFQGHWFGE